MTAVAIGAGDRAEQLVIGPGARGCQTRLGRQLTEVPIRAHLISANPSIEAPLKPLELFEGIGQGFRDIGSGFAIQPVYLDEPALTFSSDFSPSVAADAPDSRCTRNLARTPH
jgi:hypothetical protein